MKGLIKRRILDFRNDGIPDYRDRGHDVEFVKDMVSTIVGVRKGGKTYLTYQVIDEQISSGAIGGLEQVCYLHFDDEALRQLKIDDMAQIEEALLELNSSFFDKPCLLVFDEIHKVKEWEGYILRMLRKSNTRILITGSSSDLEEDKVGRQLRGKALHFNLYPLSFREYVRWHDLKVQPSRISSRLAAELNVLFDEYLLHGSFPGVLSMESNRLKERLLQSYYQAIVAGDFLEEVGSADIHVVKAFLNRVMHGNACGYNHKKMFDQLRSEGFAIAKPQVPEWYHQAEKSYFITTNKLYANSKKKIEQNPRVPYCVDWAMANFIGNPLEIKRSRALETVVFYELIRRGYKVSYFRDPQNRNIEVDFIVYKEFETPKYAIQVSCDISENDTLERELKSLRKISGYNLDGIKKLLISFTPARKVVVDDDVSVVNPVQWLLAKW